MTKGNENRPGYKKTKVGWIPVHWKLARLEECANIRFSNVDKKSNNNEISVKLCNYTDVYYNEIITNSMNFMNATATSLEIEKFSLNKGDVIITKDSETADDIGIPSFVAEELDNVICGYHLALIRPRKQLLLGEYLSKLLQLQVFRHYFFTLANGVTRFGLTSQATLHAQINLPPISEQKKIAEILSTWDRAIEQVQKLIEAKKKLKKGLMQKLLTGRLRFPEFIPKGGTRYKKTKVGWIPEDWQTKKFRDTCKLVRGPFGGTLKKEIFVKTGYKVYEQQHAICGDFNKGDYYISGSKFSEMFRFSLKPGDIIMSCSGTAGRFAIFPKDAKLGVINQALLKIRPDTNLVKTEYLFYYLNSRYFQKELFADFAGGAIKNIAGMPVIKAISIIIPSFKEQKKNAEVLENCDLEIEEIEKKMELFKQQKKGLMQKLLTGEVRVLVNI